MKYQIIKCTHKHHSPFSVSIRMQACLRKRQSIGSHFSHPGIWGQVVAGVEEGLCWGLPLFPLGLPDRTGSPSLRKSETDIVTDTSAVPVDAVAGLRTNHRGDGSLRIYPLRLVTLYLHEDRCCVGQKEDVVPKWQCASYSPPARLCLQMYPAIFLHVCICALCVHVYKHVCMFMSTCVFGGIGAWGGLKLTLA